MPTAGSATSPSSKRSSTARIAPYSSAGSRSAWSRFNRSTASSSRTKASPAATSANSTVHGLSGCRTGRIARAPEAGALLGELLLDRVLATGETAVVHYEIEDRTGLPSSNYYRFDEWGGTHYVLEVQFDRAALPVRVNEFRHRHADGADVLRQDLMLTPDGRAHLIEPSTEPGLLGISWEWD